jgi:hypothetical protein
MVVLGIGNGDDPGLPWSQSREKGVKQCQNCPTSRRHHRLRRAWSPWPVRPTRAIARRRHDQAADDVVRQSLQPVDTGSREPQPWNAGRWCVRCRGPVGQRQQLLGAHQFGWADRICSPRCGSHSARHTVLSLILGQAPGERRGSRKRAAASRIRRCDRRSPDPIQPCGRRLGKLGVLDLNQRSSRACPTIRGGRLSCSCR